LKLAGVPFATTGGGAVSKVVGHFVLAKIRAAFATEQRTIRWHRRPGREEIVETNRERRPTIAWQDVAQATALHAAGMPWREICLRTGLTEW
jgi:hypothetical protein